LFLGDPDLILLDEPTAYLDAQTRDLVFGSYFCALLKGVRCSLPRMMRRWQTSCHIAGT